MATTSTPISSSVERFNRSERWLHWAFAGPLLLAMLTGISLYFPATEKLFGSREAIRVAHWVTGFAVVILPALVVAIGDRRRLRVDLEEIDLWSTDDRAWLRAWIWRRAAPGGLPEAGRFNAGQKANATLSAAAMLWLGLTGVALFPPLHSPFWLLENSRTLHNLTWALLVPLVAGHVFLSALYAPTRPGLPGIFNGRVPSAWLRRHHPLDHVSGAPER
ncbi:MAG: cytochrome b/b6 domain-containing protein [Candidatus Dormibacteria bacterium]